MILTKICQNKRGQARMIAWSHTTVDGAQKFKPKELPLPSLFSKQIAV
jgi:hypothetical protein